MSACMHSVGPRWRWLLVGATLTASAALAGNHTGDTRVQVELDQPDRIVLEYQFPPFTHRSVELDGRRHVQVRLRGEPQLDVAGAPDLPHVVRSVVLDDSGAWAIEVLEADYRDEAGVDVAPSKGPLPRTVDPATVPYRFGPEYGRAAWYPGTWASLGTPYILRDCRGAAVDVHPYQYHPAQRTLRVCTRLRIELRRVGGQGPNPRPQRAMPRALSRAFDQLYRAHFLNYAAAARYAPLDETGDLLVICHDPWIPNLAPLVAHKNALGIDTTVVGVSTFGNNPNLIREFLQSTYATSELAFVLLAGDAAQVAPPVIGGSAADPIYAQLAGEDAYPDILVGRFSAETAAQLDTQVLRTIEYEQNQATLQDWFWRGTGIASNQGPGDDGEYDFEHMDHIREDLLAHGYTLVDQIYDPGATAQEVADALNAGRGIVNYCGHGSTTAWSTTGFNNTHVSGLRNENLLPFIISVACSNGRFAGYTCFAESWLRATHNGEPTGAVAAYMSSINQLWNPPMCAQDEVIDLLCAESYRTLGALCYAGACRMIDEYGDDGIDMFNTWHLFGDPALCVVGLAAPPTGLGVTPQGGLSAAGPRGGPFEPASRTYLLENHEATPLQWQVTSAAAWLSITPASGTLAPGETIAVEVAFGPAAEHLPNGLHTAAVEFVNLDTHVGDTAREVVLDIGVPAPLFAWNLDTDPGWSRTGEWAFGDPLGQGGSTRGFPDPQSGATGANVFGVNLEGDYSLVPGGPYYLALGPLDLRHAEQVTLRFRRWLNTDYPPYVIVKIQVSGDDLTWQDLWTTALEIADGDWTTQEFDLAALAGRPSARIRWSYEVAGGAWAYSGWNIDDVEIWGLDTSPVYVTGDLNCDGAVDFGDINPFVLALSSPSGYAAQFPDCDRMLGDANGDAVLSLGDVNPFIALLAR